MHWIWRKQQNKLKPLKIDYKLRFICSCDKKEIFHWWNTTIVLPRPHSVRVQYFITTCLVYRPPKNIKTLSICSLTWTYNRFWSLMRGDWYMMTFVSMNTTLKVLIAAQLSLWKKITNRGPKNNNKLLHKGQRTHIFRPTWLVEW